jgi:LmbE family N-acetylglucosaminyl deacetylase
MTTDPPGKRIDRRAVLGGLLGGGLAGVAATLSTSAALGSCAPPDSRRPADPRPPDGKKLKVVCVGAHPDDPESGCGGTLLRYAEAGHDVTVIYVTRGDAGSDTMTPEQMGETRTHEAEAACAILGARPVFFGQRTGDAQVTREIGDRFTELVKQIAPDVMFAHWPLDTNPDHQVAALLATRAYLKLRTPLPLYFYEVETGSETMGFHPTVFVDISATQAKKLQALQAHASQNPDRLYDNYHHLMERFRAREIAVSAAEAFVPFEPSLHEGLLPGL